LSRFAKLNTHKFLQLPDFHDAICNILKPSNFFTESVNGLPNPEKEQSMEMKSVVTAANDAVWPAQSVVSKNLGDYASDNHCI